MSSSSPSSAAVKSCLNILERAPPGDSERNVEGLSSLLSAKDKNELNQRFQHVVPIQVAKDPKDADGRSFLLSVYNRVGSSSYRSPWSNAIYQHPSLQEDTSASSSNKPPPSVRAMEQHANEVWTVFTEMYYGKQAVGSVYLWNEEGALMTGCFLAHNRVQGQDEGVPPSEWNSLHVVAVTPKKSGEALYTVQSTAWLSLQSAVKEKTLSSASVSGVLHSKTTSKVCTHDSSPSSHMENVGPILESVESDLRSHIQSICLAKTLQVVQSIRTGTTSSSSGYSKPKKKYGGMGIPVMGMPGGGDGGHAAMLNQAILARKLKKTNLE